MTKICDRNFYIARISSILPNRFLNITQKWLTTRSIKLSTSLKHCETKGSCLYHLKVFNRALKSIIIHEIVLSSIALCYNTH